jgi:hypothetical protein
MLGSTARATRPGRHARRCRRWWLPLGLAALVVATTGSAQAYWGGSGTTSGTGTSGTEAPLVMSPGTPSTALRPAGEADVVLTISNPNSTAASLTSIDLDTSQGDAGMSVDASHASCDTDALTYAAQTGEWTVPARSGSVDGSLDVVLADALAMDVGADDACQGGTFAVHLKATS